MYQTKGKWQLSFLTSSAWIGLVALLLSANLSFAQMGKPAYEQGLRDAKAGNCDQAIKKFSEAISLEPGNAKYHFNKAKCEVKLKNYNDAKISLENAIRQNNRYTAAYLSLARIYTRENDYPKAIDNYNKAYDAESDASRKLPIKLNVVKLYLTKMNKPSEAMAQLQQIPPDYASDPRVSYYKAEIMGAQSQWQQALDLYTSTYQSFVKAQQGNSRDALNCRVGMGVAYYKLGNQAKYTEILNSLTSDNATYASKLKKKVGGSATDKDLRLAKSYYSADAFDEALARVNKSLETNKSSQGYQLAAMIYNKTGQLSQAAQMYSKAVEIETDNVKKQAIYKKLVRIQYNSKDYTGALSTANQILAANSKDHVILLLKAQCEFKANQFAAAVKSAEAAAMNAPSQDPSKQAKYQFIIGMAAKRAGDQTKAKDAFKKAEVGKFKVAAIEEARSMGAK